MIGGGFPQMVSSPGSPLLCMFERCCLEKKRPKHEESVTKTDPTDHFTPLLLQDSEGGG